MRLCGVIKDLTCSFPCFTPIFAQSSLFNPEVDRVPSEQPVPLQAITYVNQAATPLNHASQEPNSHQTLAMNKSDLQRLKEQEDMMLRHAISGGWQVNHTTLPATAPDPPPRTTVRSLGHGPAPQEPEQTFSPSQAARPPTVRAAPVAAGREKERMQLCKPYCAPKLYRVSVKAFPRRGSTTQFEVDVVPSSIEEGVEGESNVGREFKVLKTYSECEELARAISLKYIRFSTKVVPHNFSTAQKLVWFLISTFTRFCA